MSESEFSRFDPAAYLTTVGDLGEYLIEAVNTDDETASVAQALATITRSPAFPGLAALIGADVDQLRETLNNNASRGFEPLLGIVRGLGLKVRLERVPDDSPARTTNP